jgi:hypothetical protein
VEPDPRSPDGDAGSGEPCRWHGRGERLYRDWTLANLLDRRASQPAWNYRNFELNGADSDYIDDVALGTFIDSVDTPNGWVTDAFVSLAKAKRSGQRLPALRRG